jgi:hypothetical protein
MRWGAPRSFAARVARVVLVRGHPAVTTTHGGYSSAMALIDEWPATGCDLCRAILRSGQAERGVDNVLTALAPMVAAVERAGTRVDSNVAWAAYFSG